MPLSTISQHHLPQINVVVKNNPKYIRPISYIVIEGIVPDFAYRRNYEENVSPATPDVSNS